MDRSSAIGQLPTAHAVAVRLRDHGFDDHVIAVAIGIGKHEVPILLRIAERKLINLLSCEETEPPLIHKSDRRQPNAQSPE
jgi:hypothetical protein